MSVSVIKFVSQLRIFVLIFGLFFSGQLFSAGLNIQVNGLSTSDGAIIIRIYDSAEGFPKDATKARVTREYPIDAANMWLTYGQLGAGEYAIVVFHDENGNGILDTNFLGIPKEPLGVSGKNKGFPSFRKSRFEITETQQIKVVEITLSKIF